MASAASPPRPPSPPPVAEDEQNKIVPCPVCGVRLKNSEVFAHLDSGECCGEAGSIERMRKQRDDKIRTMASAGGTDKPLACSL